MRPRPVACIAAAASLLALTGCPHREAKPGASTCSVFVSGYDTARLAVQATAVRLHRANAPAVWLVADSALERAARAGSLSLGTALRLLETAGVDAVLVTPGWLALGPDTLAALAGRTRIFLLSASLTDTLGEPVCHPLMVKRLGASMLGFTGLWTDSAGPLPQGVRARLAAPSRIAGTMVHLLRQRADCVGALVGPTEAMTSGGYDLVVAGATASGTSSSLVRHDVTVRAGLVERITRVEPSIGGLLPDTLVRRALGGQGDEH